MDRPIGLRSDDFRWFAMVCGESRLGVAIRIRPGAVMDRSGSNLEWPLIAPEALFDRMGPEWVGFGPDCIGFGSDKNGYYPD